MKRPDRKATCPACKEHDQDIDETFHIGRVAPHYGDIFSHCDGGWPNPPVGFGTKIDFSSYEGSSMREILAIEEQVYLDDAVSKKQLFSLVMRRMLFLVKRAKLNQLSKEAKEMESYIKGREESRHDDYLSLDALMEILKEAKEQAMKASAPRNKKA